MNNIVKSFTRDFTTYFRDVRATNTLNKVLGTNFLAVYREESSYKSKQWSYPNFKADCETFYILREDGKLVSLSNSEWFTVSLEEN